ncbi:MAG: RNase adapter RapZ [Acidobacteria bacterium]|nr:RNase adapter RapZ [Acidobacteriota bacterium]
MRVRRTRSRTSRVVKSSPAAPLVIVTGLSGAGKGSLLKAFEDIGYYCVDNLPVELIPTFADLYVKAGGEIQRAALGVDVRGGRALAQFPRLYQQLRRDVPTTLVFVEASDEVLMRRFGETRRPHPLGLGLPLSAEIRRERALLQPIRTLADLLLDTSTFSPHDLRRFVRENLVGADRKRPLILSVESFGYRYGVPTDADLVFDVRFLPNPNFVPRLKRLTGRDQRVLRYVFSFPQTREFLSRLRSLLTYLIPHYVREGKSYLTVALGCTGGQHRSVALAERLRKELTRQGFSVRVRHRDLPKAA